MGEGTPNYLLLLRLTSYTLARVTVQVRSTLGVTHTVAVVAALEAQYAGLTQADVTVALRVTLAILCPHSRSICSTALCAQHTRQANAIYNSRSRG
jgi:hypothetical protein